MSVIFFKLGYFVWGAMLLVNGITRISIEH